MTWKRLQVPLESIIITFKHKAGSLHLPTALMASLATIGQTLAWHSRFLKTFPTTWTLLLIHTFFQGSLLAIQGSYPLLELLILAFFTSVSFANIVPSMWNALLIHLHSSKTHHLSAQIPLPPLSSLSQLPSQNCFLLLTPTHGFWLYYNMYLLLPHSFPLDLAYPHSAVLYTEWLSIAVGWMKGWTE